MESRVMGNCHARFGAGENLEERICSLRLHIPPKGLPIAIWCRCFLDFLVKLRYSETKRKQNST